MHFIIIRLGMSNPFPLLVVFLSFIDNMTKD